MRSDDLTREQARALKNKLHPMLGYLNRLKKSNDTPRLPTERRVIAGHLQSRDGDA